MKRREFIKNSALALGSLPVLPEFLLGGSGVSHASAPILLVVFLRGGADGLNMVAPYSDPDYGKLRPDLKLSPPGQAGGVLDLDGRFGLHPRLAQLSSLYHNGDLAVIHAFGSHHPTRSHFDAMDIMESGSDGEKTEEGWLNRYLLDSGVEQSVFRAVALTPSLPYSLQGPVEALAISGLSVLQIGTAGSPQLRTYRKALDELYAVRNDTLGGVARSALEAASLGEGTLNPENYTPEYGADYGSGEFGEALKCTAQMIKAGVGLEVAEVDLGGWDTHTNQGNGENGALANVLSTLDQGLGAFVTDLGGRIASVAVLVMTEFGRTAAQNGSGGTDHGHGSVMFALGGNIQGGKVYGDWPGLGSSQLYEQRDLAVTTDFRRVMGEVLLSHMQSGQLDQVFPGYAYDQEPHLHLFG